MKSFSEHARTLRFEVGEALDRYTRPEERFPETLREAMRHSLLGPGKRLRPLLVLLGTEACGGQREAAMPAACAVEMVHTYSLIHDDLPAMDDDDVRRGRPSCHAQFGEAMAILAGDALLPQAFEVLGRDIYPPRIAAACCAALGRAAGPTALVGGQVDDMEAERQGGDLGVLESIHARKTGALIHVSLRLGGLVAGAREDQMEVLGTYGDKVGLAFQIVDDILDLRGDEVALGKRLGQDSARGKLTFPAILGLAESERRAGQLITEAEAALAPLGDRAGNLISLARYVVERSR